MNNENMTIEKVFLKIYPELNLGDDLFLKIILDRYPHTRFYLNAGSEYKDIFKNNSNLTVFSSINKVSLYKRGVNFIIRKFWPSKYRDTLVKTIKKNNEAYFNNTDAFVSIGGSIFMQPKILPYYYCIEYYKLINLYYKQNPKFYIGCNFGPFLDNNFKEEYESIFKKATDVCFREDYSKKLFNNLTNVRYKPDVVFGLNVNKSDKEKKSVGFSIISARGAIDSEEYIHKYAELISYYQRKGYKIYLFSFCKKEGDEETINNILKLLDKKDNINSVFYRGNIESFLKIYSSVEQVYCGRFHSMILSMLYSQKIYPVIYSDKMTNVLKDISYKGDVVFMKDFHLLDPKHLFETINSNSYDIDNEAKEAVKQFEILDKHLS